MLFRYIVGGVVLGIVLGVALGKWAVRLGMLLLLLGVVPFFFLYIYETHFYKQGDTSSAGMLCTLLLILCVPLGLVLTVTGLLRGD